MTEALAGGIGAASKQLQLQRFCVDRHQGELPTIHVPSRHPATSASSARKSSEANLARGQA